MTIDPVDAGFGSADCGEWRPLELDRPEPASEFADGFHAVRIHIQPGNYRTAGGDTCFWFRLSGFGGTEDHTVAFDVPSGQVEVAIEPTDAGFASSGCGTWTRIAE